MTDTNLEQLPCPLFGKKCIEVNSPERRCDWFMPITRNHPQIVGQKMSGFACKLDVIIMMLVDLLSVRRVPPMRGIGGEMC